MENRKRCIAEAFLLSIYRKVFGSALSVVE